MTLTRRAFATGTTALTAAVILPNSSRSQAGLYVRRSINDLIRERNPIVDAYRHGVEVMMERSVTDKTSWWFQANIHDVPDIERVQHRELATYWRQCPHRNYFFLSWHRMFLYFFERIMRKASGDPSFALPYWRYDDPQQTSLPVAFLPDADEFGTPGNDGTPPLDRRNPLARAKRHAFVDRRLIGLGDTVRDAAATMRLDRFTADDKLDALKAFGGVRTDDPTKSEASGSIEAAPHNNVHKVIGLEGDFGSPATAARDPIFWLHHANIDRMWVSWTDVSHGRIAPVDDHVWMTHKFRFVDENGEDRIMTGADVLDTQFQLAYRYDDDVPRAQRLEFRPASMAVRSAPGAPPMAAFRPVPGASAADTRATAPIVLASSSTVKLAARESTVALATAGPGFANPDAATSQLHIVLKDVVARDRSPPYDVFLRSVASSDPSAKAVRIGALDLFGGAGQSGHSHGARGSDQASDQAHSTMAGDATLGDTIALDVSEAVTELARVPGFDLQRLQISIKRRGFAHASGREFVPDDPDPPQIGSIELIKS